MVWVCHEAAGIYCPSIQYSVTCQFCIVCVVPGNGLKWYFLSPLYQNILGLLGIYLKLIAFYLFKRNDCTFLNFVEETENEPPLEKTNNLNM